MRGYFGNNNSLLLFDIYFDSQRHDTFNFLEWWSSKYITRNWVESSAAKRMRETKECDR